MVFMRETGALPGTCHIVGAAPGALSIEIRPGDLCVAADGGGKALEALGIAPDMVIGDFDSSFPPEDIPAIRLNPEKDVTDLYAAVQIGKERGYGSFLLYGALGGSWGHSAGNLQILAGLAREGFGAAIIAEGVRVSALHSGSLTLASSHGRRVSVLAHGGSAEGVTLMGMRYPLNNAALDCFFPLGVSNEILGDEAEITVKQGTLMIFQEESTPPAHIY